MRIIIISLKMSFQDIDCSITDIFNNHKKMYRDVLKQLIAATQCHSCGYKIPVCLLGYVGRHCSKSCWKSLFYETYNDCIIEDCEFCPNESLISFANSKYHMMSKKAFSKTGYYWPMCNPNTECTNSCIMNKQTIAIPTYNY